MGPGSTRSKRTVPDSVATPYSFIAFSSFDFWETRGFVQVCVTPARAHRGDRSRSARKSAATRRRPQGGARRGYKNSGGHAPSGALVPHSRDTLRAWKLPHMTSG